MQKEQSELLNVIKESKNNILQHENRSFGGHLVVFDLGASHFHLRNCYNGKYQHVEQVSLQPLLVLEDKIKIMIGVKSNDDC